MAMNPLIFVPLLFAFILASVIGPVSPLAGGVIGFLMLPLALVTYRVHQLHETLPRATIGRKWSDLTIAERLLSLTPGVSRADCGCLYTRLGYSGSHPDRIDVDDDPDYVWERRVDGARVKYKLKMETMKRCTSCGRHVHGRDNVTSLHMPNNVNTTRHKVWEDDPLPDEIAETNYEIIELDTED